ncbi:MAG: asparagine synthetase B family protein [Alphaproteobacteria bacterium]
MGAIAGYIHLERGRADSAVLAPMVRAMAHRGPDDEGFVAIDTPERAFISFAGAGTVPALAARMPKLGTAGPLARLGLAQRRLAGSDRTDRAHQPFISADGRFILAFDGTVYNAQDLRRDLTVRGTRFRTTSDTEVLMEVIRDWGPEGLARVNGVWALALYDADRDRLILSRDPLGVKPLYWTRSGPILYFASEIKGLLAVPSVAGQRRLDRGATARWLLFGAKGPGSTLYRDIRPIGAGTVTRAADPFPGQPMPLWSMPRSRLRPGDVGPDEAAATLRDLLADAVSIRIAKDGPAAAILDPAGPDGHLGCAMVTVLAGRSAGRRIHTYAEEIGAFGAPSSHGPAVRLASRIADGTDSLHQVVPVPLLGLWRLAGSFSTLMDEPFDDPLLCARQMLLASMSGQGALGALSGTGAGALFGAGRRHGQGALASALAGGRLGAVITAMTASGALPWPRSVRGRTAWTDLDQAIRRAALVSLLGQDGTAHRAGPPLPDRLAQAHLSGLNAGRLNPHRAWSLEGMLVEAATRTDLPDRLGCLGQAAMGVPFDLAMPFLDRRVADFAFRLPGAYLARDGAPGWILRRAMTDLLPADLVWRMAAPPPALPRRAFQKMMRPLTDCVLDGLEGPAIPEQDRRLIRTNWPLIGFLLWHEGVFKGNERLLRTVEAKASALYGAGPEDPILPMRAAYLDGRALPVAA